MELIITFVDKEKSVANRQQLEGQLTENTMVKEVCVFLFSLILTARDLNRTPRFRLVQIVLPHQFDWFRLVTPSIFCYFFDF